MARIKRVGRAKAKVFACPGNPEDEENDKEEEGGGEVDEEDGDSTSTISVEEEDADGLKAQLAELGLRIESIKGDGNCLFRALSDQLCGDQEYHVGCRQMVVQYLKKHPEEFAGFFSEKEADSFEEYCTNMSHDSEWGGNLELQAASKAAQVNIRIYRFDQGRLAVSDISNFHDKDRTTFSLSYHNGNHYNSLRKSKDSDSSEGPEIIV